MRPVQIMDNPIQDPYVCIKCGAGSGSDRRHFADLGVDSQMKKEDEFGQMHLSEGVIYFCNMCIMSLIGDYLGQLFNFINNQERTFNLTEQQRADGLTTLHNEIYMIREQLDKRDEELKEAKLQLAEYENASAAEIVKGVLGGGSSEDDAGSNPDSEGTNQGSDGNDTATQPDYTADSLFQLHLAIAKDNNP